MNNGKKKFTSVTEWLKYNKLRFLAGITAIGATVGIGVHSLVNTNKQSGNNEPSYSNEDITPTPNNPVETPNVKEEHTHNFEYVETKDAFDTYVCTICGEEYKDVHVHDIVVDNYDDEYEYGHCILCGLATIDTHILVDGPLMDDGSYTEYCFNCDYTKDILPELSSEEPTKNPISKPSPIVVPSNEVTPTVSPSNEPTPSVKPTHEHVYGDPVGKYICNEDGTHTYIVTRTCIDNDSTIEVSRFTEKCNGTVKGYNNSYEEVVCSKCNYEYHREHNLNEGVLVNSDKIQNCLNPGCSYQKVTPTVTETPEPIVNPTPIVTETPTPIVTPTPTTPVHTHSYYIANYDDDYEYLYCSGCTSTKTVAHSKTSTTNIDGSITYTCTHTGCGWTKTTSPTIPDPTPTPTTPVHTHQYGEWQNNGDSGEIRYCSCGDSETRSHTLTESTDIIKNAGSATHNVVKHTNCSTCTYTKDENLETNTQCTLVLQSSSDPTYSTTEEDHHNIVDTYKCSVCNGTVSQLRNESCTYSGATCVYCGHTKANTHTHTWDSGTTIYEPYNDSQHKVIFTRKCTQAGCNEEDVQITYASHNGATNKYTSNGDEATHSHKYFCSLCGFEYTRNESCQFVDTGLDDGVDKFQECIHCNQDRIVPIDTPSYSAGTSPSIKKMTFEYDNALGQVETLVLKRKKNK